MRLTGQVGVPVPVSPVLFEAVRFSLAVAAESDGAFDPTIGRDMERRGFNREYSTGRRIDSSRACSSDETSYRDVAIDPERRTITLTRPVVIDLGAVAKGLAVDVAARELRPFTNFAIDAGGDLYLGGKNSNGDAWSVGIRHPRLEHQMIATVHVSDRAVCTSGDYERRGDAESGHVIDPRTHDPAAGIASVTVIAPTALAADALATAAMVLGPDQGIDLLERAGVQGLMLSTEMQRFQTREFPVA